MDFFVVYIFYNKLTLFAFLEAYGIKYGINVFGTLTFLSSGTIKKLMSSTEIEMETRQKNYSKGKSLGLGRRCKKWANFKGSIECSCS